MLYTHGGKESSLGKSRRWRPRRHRAWPAAARSDCLRPIAERMSLSAYETLVRRLYTINMYHPAKLGLDNMRALHDRLGAPLDHELHRKVIHVAGTNGKGSVAWKVGRALQSAGLKTGLFVSPHISSFRERAQVDGALISEAHVTNLLSEVFDAMDREEPIKSTFFEITTALALRHFALENVDAVVLEAGLGGRLDATNIVREPALSVITSVSLEHTRILGETVEAIASEKAGIMKQGVPVVVGPHVPHAVLRAHASKLSCPYHECAVRSDAPTDFDAENGLVAAEALRQLAPVYGDLSPHIAAGLASAPPCRFEVRQFGATTVVFDVAHNPAALERLREKIAVTFPGFAVRVILGLSRDKNLSLCLSTITQFVTAGRLHTIEASHPRAVPARELAEHANALGLGPAPGSGDGSIRAVIAEALAASTTSAEDEILVVCGSAFIMSDARTAFGYEEPRDSLHIAEVSGAHLRHAQENMPEDLQDTQR